MILSVVVQQVEPSALTLAGVAAVATAFVTIAAALLYILGLLALVVPIRRITGDFVTVWYSTFLIPKTVVAGEDIRVFAYPLFVTTLVALTLTVILSTGLLYVMFSQSVPESSWPDWVIFILLFYSIVIPLFVLLFFGPWIVQSLAKNRFPTIARGARRWGLVMKDVGRGYSFYRQPSLAGKFQGGISYISGFGISLAPTLKHGLGISIGWTILLCSIWFFATVFIGSVPVAVSQDPPLPKVRLIGVENPTEGSLIDRSSGGVWHILGQDGIIRAIPDGQIKAAYIYAR